jgi:hypothetical protein
VSLAAAIAIDLQELTHEFALVNYPYTALEFLRALLRYVTSFPQFKDIEVKRCKITADLVSMISKVQPLLYFNQIQVKVSKEVRLSRFKSSKTEEH